jgi:hypothetical protein
MIVAGLGEISRISISPNVTVGYEGIYGATKDLESFKQSQGLLCLGAI